MKKFKLFISVIACVTLVSGLAACGNASGSEQSQQAQPETNVSAVESDTAATENESSEVKQEETWSQETASETAAEDETESGNKADTAVIYFSATGTTRGVAEKIAAAEDADIYEILASEIYTSDDLNYNDSNSRTTKEQNDKSVRPEIASETIDLSGYLRIYIGYPIWWGEEPRIMDTFVESYDFENIVMIPFCTSGGSGIGRSGSNLAENAGSGDWKDGKRLQSSISDADLQAWIDSYK